MIGATSRGSSRKLRKELKAMLEGDIYKDLEMYGRRGVEALRAATPQDDGETASSWDFVIERNRKSTTLSWINTHRNKGANIAILIQYGHGTGTGGYVQGRDFINPAIQPIFDEIADGIWKRVTQ